ncbi:MAG TPA: class I SAM-dependent methyltransferase [Terriglobales bacterium]|nr:class I SAM-dependent methyltransferase [Terriglobales bacterium]
MSAVGETNVIAATGPLSAALHPCPLCRSCDFKPLFGSIQRCRYCRLVQVNPITLYRGENETEEYFLHDYLKLHEANRENSLAERREHIRFMRRSFQLPASPRMLDVGCALGFMLQEANALGWHAEGVETSEFAARYAAERTGCRVHVGTLQRANLQPESFDVVTAMDVIEHIPEPLEFVQEVYRILRPGGVMFIVTPNFSSFFARLYGPSAYAVWPDQHVVYFDPSTISHLLRKAGFKQVKTGSKDFYAENLRRLFRRNGVPSSEIKGAFGKQRSLRVVRQFVNECFMHVRLGDKLLAVARK